MAGVITPQHKKYILLQNLLCCLQIYVTEHGNVLSMVGLGTGLMTLHHKKAILLQIIL